MEVYHYRSIEAALLELSEGAFRFAKQEELNDPIEGYISVYWAGDRAAWEGLFRNYICSLYRCMDLFFRGTAADDLFRQMIETDYHRYDKRKRGPVYERITRAFLEDPSVQECIELLMHVLGGATQGCSGRILSLWLTLLQFTAYNICAQSFSGYIQLKPVEEWSVNSFHEIVEAIETLMPENGVLQDASERMLETIEDYLEAIAIVRFAGEKRRALDDRRRQLWLEITSNFAYHYVAQLEALMYPGGMVVCFSKEKDNSVMWANYADKHQGVCLVYELPLEGVSGSLEMVSTHSKRSVTVNAAPIAYKEDAVARNFFESLGHFEHGQVAEWLGGRESIVLDCYAHLDMWQARYWRDFRKKFFTKMPAWAYENEYRLLVSDTFFDGQEEQCFKYPKTALKEIIFGKATSVADKVRILKTAQCAGFSLDDITVSRAVYDAHQRRISIKENDMLRKLL